MIVGERERTLPPSDFPLPQLAPYPAKHETKKALWVWFVAGPHCQEKHFARPELPSPKSGSQAKQGQTFGNNPKLIDDRVPSSSTLITPGGKKNRTTLYLNLPILWWLLLQGANLVRGYYFEKHPLCYNSHGKMGPPCIGPLWLKSFVWPLSARAAAEVAQAPPQSS